MLFLSFNIMCISSFFFFGPGNDESGKPYTPQGVVGFRPLEQLESQFGLKQFTPQVAQPESVEQAADTAA